MLVPQLSRAADEICRGESVDCKNFVSMRRLDGKCNNLKNTTSSNWGASAIAMRRMAPTAYDDGFHTPRKVNNHHNFSLLTTFLETKVLWQVNISPRRVSDAMHKTTGSTPRLSRKGLRSRSSTLTCYRNMQEGVHPHGHAVWTVPRP